MPIHIQLKKSVNHLWLHSKSLNILALLMIICAINIVLFAGISWVKRHSWFDIQELIITGMRGNQDLQHQSAKLIQSQLMKELRGNLLTADLKQIQTVFLKTPWIRHVEVRRVWPNRLWVIIEEHQPIAQLNTDFWVNDRAEVFFKPQNTTTHLSKQLPQWYGLPNEVMTLKQRFDDLNQWLAPTQLKVKTLSFSDRRAWTAELSNQFILDLGRDELEPSVHDRVIQWGSTWKSTSSEVLKHLNITAPLLPLRIDLRYPNGYAISPL